MATNPGMTLFKASMSRPQPAIARPLTRITATPAVRAKYKKPVGVRGRAEMLMTELGQSLRRLIYQAS